MKLDRDSDGLISAFDIEVGLLGASPEEIEEESKSPTSRGSLTILSPRKQTNKLMS